MICERSFSQVADDFEDGDLSVNPVWSGDITHFKTTAEGILRLDAPAAGRSFIFTRYTLPDSFKIILDHGLEFSPSSGNLSKIYLFTDNTDLTKANGYYLNFGENGNEDAIRLFKMINGNATNIASAKVGAIANNTNDIKLELTYNSKSEWILKASYDRSASLSQEFIIKDNFTFNKSGFFGIECIYTSTRRDKYYFDNLSLDVLRPDTKAPALVSGKITGPTTIDVEFSEDIVRPLVSQVNVNPAIEIKEIIYQSGRRNAISIITNTPVKEGISYTVIISNIADEAGNVLSKSEFNAGLFRGPVAGDMVLTEILFDPATNGEDYVEFFNQSNKIINLNGSKIGNPSRNQEVKILKDVLVPPKTYICLTPSADVIRPIYTPPANAVIISQAIPLFNADQGKASLINEFGSVIDSMTYSENMHNALLNNTKGVSLERIRANDGSFTSLWTSGVKSTNFGTPGYENSNTAGNTTGEMFELVNKTFSPNGDGEKDLILLSYNLPKPGFIASINIYSETGHLIKKLTSGELLAAKGLISWNGLNDKDELERIGVYNIVLKAFHADGETIQSVFNCILANK